ncbi:HlyD family efflux transporter periplasmic adaptor subunit [Trichlorobacter ammonificans]|uniref:Peptidase M50 n=1 Tax=Trichlorobacter ammonificans TaxID=2916410 RepID=A0ABM9D555_9BACT|nr:HlyD family efflux transporter periplasmic adaptor subunit [Trichlorobacter ammonificans]CAH2029845.1 Peptidase M50 [Trichlorobacter ammonificans]
MVGAAAIVPPLRQDVGLFPAPPQRDGSPVWSLHDPAANRFYLITWPAFEMLSRWHLGSPQAIAESVCRETTLELGAEDVASLAPFLESNFLTEPQGAGGTARLLAARERMRSHWWQRLFKNYLFFRIPLVRPQRFLEAIAPLTAPLFSPAFLSLVLVVALCGLLLLTRHWDQFLHSFTAYRSVEGMLALALALGAAKVIHELGHACASLRYGCRVPAMGVAFMVLAPMLYTDTNEAWKLSSRRQRLIIGSSGVLAELTLAVAATWGWLLLPDGPLRGAAFFLASTAWIMTLAVNCSPFMRFDGYFILSDLLSIPNLHARSFAFGRWRLRELLFGYGDPPPEAAGSGLRRFLTVFAWGVWLYRLVLFLGIALLVYHFFFKALGMLLFAVEVGWFIALPVASELKVWWQRRGSLRPNRALARTVLLLLAGAGLLLLPWQATVRAPAVLGAIVEQRLSAPAPGIMVYGPAPLRTEVREGELLARLQSPDLEARMAQVLPGASVASWQVRQQAFSEELTAQGNVLRKRAEGSSGQIGGLRAEMDQLRLMAPFDGVVVYRNDDIMAGGWVAAREWVLSVADLRANRVDVYLEEQDLRRIRVGGRGRFIPDALEYGAFSCRIAAIDRVAVATLDDPSLASTYGGPIPTDAARQHELTPLVPRFRVRLDQCDPGGVPPLRLRGVAHLDADRQSPALELLRHAWVTLIRESGL